MKPPTWSHALSGFLLGPGLGAIAIGHGFAFASDQASARYWFVAAMVVLAFMAGMRSGAWLERKDLEREARRHAGGAQ